VIVRVAGAVLVFFLSLLVLPRAAAQGSPSLNDQFGHEVRIAIGEGRVTIILTSDRRDAAELIEEWVRALAPFPEGVAAHFVANLKALPFFVPRAAVTSSLVRQHPSTPVLLDWTGSFSRSLYAAKNDVSVLVFAPDGQLAARANGKPSSAAIADLRAVLARLSARR
jgi:hypothetical protein